MGSTVPHRIQSLTSGHVSEARHHGGASRTFIIGGDEIAAVVRGDLKRTADNSAALAIAASRTARLAVLAMLDAGFSPTMIETELAAAQTEITDLWKDCKPKDLQPDAAKPAAPDFAKPAAPVVAEEKPE